MSIRSSVPAVALSRRAFVACAAGAAACSLGGATGPDPSATAQAGRLAARPGTPTRPRAPGRHELRNGSVLEAILVVPPGLPADAPAPLVVALHGAGITATGPIDFLGPYAESDRFVLLSPESTGTTWDAIRGGYGPDVALIDRALATTFAGTAIDAARVTLEGFSDGATYALALGLMNGDLFRRVAAFSPGFVTPVLSTHGAPPLFVSHGRQDPVLPIDQASRRIVPALQAAGYAVEYLEYEGVHSVPAAVARAGVDFLLRR